VFARLYRAVFGADDIRQAERLAERARELARARRTREALAAQAESVVFYRRSLGEGDRSSLVLGHALICLAQQQRASGLTPHAVATLEEAIGRLRGIRELPEALPQLAWALDDLALCRDALGDAQAACAIVEEAITLHRDLAAEGSERAAALAGALTNLSAFARVAGRGAVALAAAEEAVAIHDRLAQDEPNRWMADRARSRVTLSIQQVHAGRIEEAAVHAEAAVSLLDACQGAEGASAALAHSLSHLAQVRYRLDDNAQAVAPAARAVELYRTLGAGTPREDLAASLVDLALPQGAFGQRAEALASLSEAVALRRQLAAQGATAARVRLADALGNLAIAEAGVGQLSAALTTQL
jgi:tetratricopeptide (TPR) repeat protein